MGINLSGNYKGADYIISQDGMTYIICFNNKYGVIRGQIEREKLIGLSYSQIVEKVRNKVYYEINKVKNKK